jgi:hypothetical protein
MYKIVVTLLFVSFYGNSNAQILNVWQEAHIANARLNKTFEYLQEISNTKTRNFNRWYSHVLALNAYNISKNKPTFLVDSLRATATLWQDSTMIGTFLSPNGISYKPIQFKAFANTFDPYAAIYNDNSIYPTALKLNTSNSYTIDSFAIIGNYINMKPNIRDTLIISMCYGSGADSTDNKLFFYGPGNAVAANFSVDTLRYVCGKFNFSSYTLNGMTTVTQKIILNAATMNDTIPGGFNRFVVPIKLNIPAFRIASTSVSFKSGDTWTPGDTALKFNRLKLYSYKEKYNNYGSYFKYNYNSSQLVFNQKDYWNIHPWPSFAFPQDYLFEQHWCSYLVSANPTKLNSEIIKDGVSLFPNPATSDLNISISKDLTQSPIKVSILNSLGQTLKSTIISNEAKISITDLPAASYFIVAENKSFKWNTRFIKQ